MHGAITLSEGSSRLKSKLTEQRRGSTAPRSGPPLKHKSHTLTPNCGRHDWTLTVLLRSDSRALTAKARQLLTWTLLQEIQTGVSAAHPHDPVNVTWMVYDSTSTPLTSASGIAAPRMWWPLLNVSHPALMGEGEVSLLTRGEV